MESTIKIIKQFFKGELGSKNDIQIFIKNFTDNDLERLESLKKDVLNEIENQKFIDEIGIRDRIDKPIQQGVVIRFGEITPEQTKKMIAEKRRLDGYSNLKRLLKAIDAKIENFEPSLDEKIEIYVNKIKPGSPNKKDYQKAFHFIYELPNAKDYTNTELADKILLEYDDLAIKEESLRRIVRPFINKFLL